MRQPGRLTMVAAIVGAVLIVGAGPAAAEGDLRIEADAVYEFAPEESRLEVTVSFLLTNQKPPTTSESVINRYYYDSFRILLPDEAIEVVVVDDRGRSLGFSEAIEVLDDDGKTGRVITVAFPAIFYQGQQAIALSFHLPGGEPRSESAVRANPAYGAFSAWAWGDAGLSDVTIRIPTRFAADYRGDELDVDVGEDVTTWYRTGVDDPAEWGVFFTARHDEALVSTVMEVEGLIVTVRSWPGDEVWALRVSELVRRGLPALQDAIGLGVGDQTTLDIFETLDPTLLGYAGWYLAYEDVIELGEDLDDHTILHEISHLWANSELFTGRWIAEGLAEELAATAFDAIDGEGVPERPSPPATDVPVAVPLNRWDVPRRAPGEDEESFQREDYGYNASFWVMRALHEEIGADGLQAVIAAAANDLTAYQDGSAPETVAATDGWQRFLDLLEEVGGSTGAEALFREFVAAPVDLTLLDERRSAREIYATLLVADTDWETPWAVRQPLGEWQFRTAEQTITSAQAVVTLRDRIEETADHLDLTPPPELEVAYENAQIPQDLITATAIGEDQLEAVTAVEAASVAVAAERGFFETVGLLGDDPGDALLDAATAFEAGRHDDAEMLAADVIDLIDQAEDVGQGRVMRTAAAVVLVGGAVVLVVVLRRRRGTGPGGVAGS
ncbi:MAG: hypothetical protein HZA58_08615 [Acidimicrobiia bacterium]|nr:hypothetical protein [Acidimicrobiia bacterium]